MHSYVVIGGGIAGLTAANALAGEGNQVTLLEQSRHLGGRAQTQQQDGFLMNLGPHALYCGGTAMQTFRDWQIPFSGKVPPTSSRSYFVRGEALFPIVRNLSGLLSTRLFGLREKLEVARLLQLFSAGKAAAGETMQAWLQQHTHSQPVHDFAATVTRIATYAADLRHLSAEAALRQLALAIEHNVFYLDGGWQTLVEGLAARARALGVEIRCEQPVGSLDALDADGIVLAAGPASVEKLTGIRLPARRPLRVASLDLAMNELPEDAALVAFTLERPLYYSVHSASARLAPEHGALVHVARYLDDAAADPTAIRAELEDYATLVMPQWRRFVKHARFLPSLTVTPMMPTPEGRPDVDALNQEGLAIAGDWVGNDGMLADAAVSSALKAASLVQQRKALVA